MPHFELGPASIGAVAKSEAMGGDWRRGRGRRVEGVSLMDRQHCFPMPKMEGFFFHIFVFCD